MQFPITEAIPERSTYAYTAQLRNPDGTNVQAGQLTSILLTLIDVRTGLIINARNAVNVLSGGAGGTVVDGLFTMAFVSADHAIFGTALYELHRAIFDINLTTGGRRTHQVQYYVQNFSNIS